MKQKKKMTNSNLIDKKGILYAHVKKSVYRIYFLYMSEHEAKKKND